MKADILHYGAYMCIHTHPLGSLADYFYTTVNKPKSLKCGATLNGSLNDTRKEEERRPGYMQRAGLTEILQWWLLGKQG